jgi:predicted acetyltransferase
MTDLYLAEPTMDLEAEAMAYRAEYLAHGETHINGSLGLIRYDRYSEWLHEVQLAQREETSRLGVAATTYFTVRRSDGRIVGTVQLRHTLNDDLRRRGGHIGYGIRPSERGKGYGTAQLALVLEKARELGLPRVMISCDRDNLASARVAEKNGARLEWEGYDEEDGWIRIYWIELPQGR